MKETPTLLETMRLEDGQVALLERHLSRMARSAVEFGTPFDIDVARSFLRIMLPGIASRKRPVRVRLTLGPRGHLHVSEASTDVSPFRIAWIDTVEPFHEADSVYARHKTTEREMYASHRKRARRMGAHDAILLDPDGCVIEATTANVFARFGDMLVTPDLRSGGLAGVSREYILDTEPNAVEARLHADELRTASKVYLSNAVRGLMEVSVI